MTVAPSLLLIERVLLSVKLKEISSVFTLLLNEDNQIQTFSNAHID